MTTNKNSIPWRHFRSRILEAFGELGAPALTIRGLDGTTLIKLPSFYTGEVSCTRRNKLLASSVKAHQEVERRRRKRKGATQVSLLCWLATKMLFNKGWKQLRNDVGTDFATGLTFPEMTPSMVAKEV
jgi:hypothetical protein